MCSANFGLVNNEKYFCSFDFSVMFRQDMIRYWRYRDVLIIILILILALIT